MCVWENLNNSFYFELSNYAAESKANEVVQEESYIYKNILFQRNYAI